MQEIIDLLNQIGSQKLKISHQYYNYCQLSNHIKNDISSKYHEKTLWQKSNEQD